MKSKFGIKGITRMGNKIDVSVPEAARLLGVTLKYVYDLLYSGRLRAEKKLGRWRIPTTEIAARLQKRGER